MSFHIDDLPQSVCLSFISLLSVKDLIALSEVSRHFASICTDEHIWQTLYEATWPREAQLGIFVDSTWKSRYKSKFQIERNWSEEKYQSTTIASHEGPVTCMQFVEGKIYGGSSDNCSARVWDVYGGGSCLRHLHTHDGPVTCICTITSTTQDADDVSQLQQKRYVITGCADGLVRVFLEDAEEPIHVLFRHHGSVWALQRLEETDVLVSGGADACLRTWDLKSGSCLNVLVGHTRGIHAIRCGSGRIVSAAGDGTCRIWCSSTGSALAALSEHVGEVSCLELANRAPVVECVSEVQASPRCRSSDGASDLGPPGSPASQFRLRGAASGSARAPEDVLILTAGSDRVLKSWVLEGPTSSYHTFT
ncbi:hypothetical protein CYMTET_22502, partial [Cymbomonas tetramitiformis]